MQYLSLKMGPRLPRLLRNHQISTPAGRFSSGSVGCCPHSVLGCLLLRGGSEGFLSFLAHLGTGRGSDGRLEVELGCAWLAVRSHPVPPGLGDTWASLECPLLAQHATPLAQPVPHSRTLLLSLTPGLPPRALTGNFPHCFSFTDPLIG